MPGANILSTKLLIDADSYIRGMRGAERATDRLNKRLVVTQAQSGGLTRGITALRGALLPATVAVGALGAAAAAAVRHSARFDTVITRVAKTTGLTGRALDGLRDGLNNMSVQLGASREELGEIAAIAGQLGVQGIDNITSFTKVVSQLAGASDLSADAAATMGARFLNLSNLPTSEMRRFADVIVNLGNSMAVTESEITGMALGLRQASLGVDFSVEFLGALSATTAESGIQAESARTSFQKLLVSIEELTVKGGRGLAGLAEAMELTVEQARALFEQNPDAFIARLFEGAGDLRSQDFNRLLSTLDQEGARGRVFFGSGVEAARTGNLREALGLANDSEGSTAREARAVRESLQGQVDAALAQFAVQFGRITDVVAPDLVNSFTLLSQGLGGAIDLLGLLGDGINFLLPGVGELGRTLRDAVFSGVERENQLIASGLTPAQAAQSTELTRLLSDRTRADEELVQAQKDLAAVTKRISDRGGFILGDEASERDRREEERLEGLIEAIQSRQGSRQTQIDALRDLLTPVVAPSTADPEPGTGARSVEEILQERAIEAFQNAGRTREAQFIRDRADLEAAGGSRAELETLTLTRQVADLEDKIKEARLTGNDEVIQRLEAQQYAANVRLQTAREEVAAEEEALEKTRERALLLDDIRAGRTLASLAEIGDDRREETRQEVTGFGTELNRLGRVGRGESQDQLEVRRAEVEAYTEAVSANVDQLVERWRAGQEAIAEQNKLIADSIAESLVNPLEALVSGGSFTDALGQSLEALSQQILQMGVLKPIIDQLSGSIQGLLGGGGAGGGIGGLLGGGGGILSNLVGAGAGGGGGGLFSALLGGGGSLLSGIGSLFGLPFLNTGGRVTRSGLAVVGERGAEVVSLPAGASVHPNGTVPGGGAGGAGGLVANVNININVSDDDRVPEAIREQIPVIRDIIEQGIEGRFNNPMDSLSLAARG